MVKTIKHTEQTEGADRTQALPLQRTNYLATQVSLDAQSHQNCLQNKSREAEGRREEEKMKERKRLRITCHPS